MSKKSTKLLLIMFLVGIFMGSLDTAIVSPARTVMGNTLHISADASIWIITLYSLIYAVSMPIVGKLADRNGLKTMFTISVLFFGVGSLLCGLSNYYSSFEFLLIARAIEAIGAGGIIPIATAFVGDSFPPEKRGAALGMVGGINGIATLIGPALGSFILDTWGTDRWGILFFINVPICLIVLISLVTIKLPKIDRVRKKMDLAGSVASGLFIITLMLFVTNLNFTDLVVSFKADTCYPYLIAAIILLPILIFIESRAEDPIINLKYFKDKQMVAVFIIAFLVGASLMVVVFLPQFCSNVLKLKLGSGGYFVTLMALFTGIASPFGGRLVDKLSAKFVLIIGFVCSLIGMLILAFIVTSTLSLVALVIGLAFMGLGIGFTMGTPLNYIVQSSVPKEEIGSAQSTLSLIRSLGIALSPNLLVGFIVQAGTKMPDKLMAVLPKAHGMALSMGSGVSSPSMVSAFQNANITTIFSLVRNLVNTQFTSSASKIEAGLKGKLPVGVSPIEAVTQMKNSYLLEVDKVRGTIETTYQQVMNQGFEKMFITLAIIAAIAIVSALVIPNKMKKIA